MASVNSTSSSTSSNRLTGFATGLDTDQMVKDMLTNEQSKIDRVKQQQTLVEWKQEEYREIIGDAKELYSKYFDPLSNDYMLSTKSLSTTTITSSNTSVITATAQSGAIPPNYNFEVKQTASSAQMSSNLSVGKTDKLADLGINGETSFKINYGDGKSSSVITINPDDTIESLTEKINKASDGNFKAVYSEMTGKFTLSSNTTGVNAKLSISNGSVDVNGNFVENGNSDALSFLGIDGKKVEGKNAQVVVTDMDGNLVKEISSEKNTFLIDNVSYNVNGVGSSRLTSMTDTTKAVENMKNFIEDYNKLVDRVHSNITEKKNPDYEPLTEAQKAEMSEEEIEK